MLIVCFISNYRTAQITAAERMCSWIEFKTFLHGSYASGIYPFHINAGNLYDNAEFLVREVL